MPEPVTLGSWTGQAIQFRLRDLAHLQGIVRSLAGNPMAGKRAALAVAREAAGGDYLGQSPECIAYAALLREAIRGSRAWPPPLGGPEADRLLATGPGAVLWLEALLSRDWQGRPLNPGFDFTTAAKAITEADPEQYRTVVAIAYADHPLDEAGRLADPHPRGRKATDWAEAIWETMGRHPVYTLEAIGDLYLSQWALLRSEGKARPGLIPGDKARQRAVAARQRRLIAGDATQLAPSRNGSRFSGL